MSGAAIPFYRAPSWQSKRRSMAEKKPEAAKPAFMNRGIGGLLGLVGEILVLLGALLPWATVSGGGRSAPETFLGVTSGLFGILLSQLGFFSIIMMMDGKKTTIIAAIIMGFFSIFLSALSLVFPKELTAFGAESGAVIENSVGLYLCTIGGIVLLLGSIFALIEAGKPGKVPTPMPKAPAKGKPMEAILLFVFTLAAAVLLLVNPWTLGDTDALGAILLVFGLLLIPTSYYVFKVEYWSWGTVLIVLLVVLLFAIPAAHFVAIAFFDALFVVLYVTRLTYGVGLWKIEQAIEEEQRKEREEIRVSNPEGLHCPRCKSNDIYICEDASTFCRSCNVGFVSIEDAAAKPKSSMQGT